MPHFIRHWCWLLGWLLLLTASAAVPPAALPPRPEPPRLLNDLAGVLAPAQQQALETKLRRYADTTSTQVAVVVVRSIGPYEVADYAQQLGQSWGVGQQGHDNGLVVLLALDRPQVTIQTGYGMEGAITDALTNRIIREQFQPNFRQGRYYEGLDAGLDVLFRRAAGEFKAPPADFSWGAALVLGLMLLAGLAFAWLIVWIVVKAVRPARGARETAAAASRSLGKSAADWAAFNAQMAASQARMASRQQAMWDAADRSQQQWQQQMADWMSRPATSTGAAPAADFSSATDAPPAAEVAPASEPVTASTEPTASTTEPWAWSAPVYEPPVVPEPAAPYEPPTFPDPPTPTTPDFDGFGGGHFGGGGSSGHW